MKKTIKWLLITIGIVFFSIVIFFISYGIRAQSEVKTMTPVASGELIENIFALQDGFANVYVVKDCIQYIVIDAGNKMEAISEELEKLEINPELVAAVFLTHSDGDHVAAVSLFENAKVYLSKQEEQMINGETSRFFLFGNTIDTKEYNLIDDQQIVNIGNIKVKGILNPGHTPGSMSFLINDKYLFTGDAISLKNGKIQKFNEFFNMDTEIADKSIEIITKIPEAEYIFTAHHGYTDDYKNAAKDWGNRLNFKIAMSCTVSYYYNKSEDLFTRTFRGTVTMDDIISSWIYIIKNKVLTKNHKAVISDYSKATLELKIEDVQKFRNFLNKNIDLFKNLRMAQVAISPQIVFPMIFEQESKEFKSKPFSTLKAAEYWANNKGEL